MHKLQNTLLICISLLLINASNPDAIHIKEKKYLPKEFKKVRFSMNLEELRKVRKNPLKDVSDPDYDFRKVYQEEVNRNGIETVVYYFDNEGSLPLYEIIVVYDSEKSRDLVAKKLLGTPNYQGKEWKIDAGIDYPLHAWTHQNKLIYAVPLKGSEWENELE